MQTHHFDQIDGISEGTVELLEAVGIEDLVDLAESESASLVDELAQANAHLKIAEESPASDFVESWVEKARKITGKEPQEVSVVRLEEIEEAEEVVQVLQALPIEKDYIIKHEIAVGEVPIMEDFVEGVQLEMAAATRAEGVRKEKIREIAPEATPKKKETPRKFEKPKEEKDRPVIEPLQRGDGIDIRKTASLELNEGKKMHSRGYVRGVLHPQPARVKVAALVSAILLMLIPASFVAGILVLLEYPKSLLFIPLAFFVFGLLYLTIARSLKCRICGQPLFSPKSCRRHVKAHHLPLIGYIFPTSLHMFFFSWFRCIYCGTSVRLKE